MGDEPVGADLSVRSLNEALRPHLSGVVVDTKLEPIGTGQMADSTRVHLTYDRPDAGPPTVVAKHPSHDATSRATARAVRNYEIETSFYRELAPTLPVRAPQCLHVRHDVETDDFLLLLEDLAPAQQGDQLAGCDVDEAAAAVEELARLHAPRWGDPTLAERPWLNRNPGDRGEGVIALYAGVLDGFVERYRDRLEPDVLELAGRYATRMPAYFVELPAATTIVHGDYRLDNLLFADGGGRVGVVDWQTVTYGSGVTDLSYFLGAGLLTDDRRAHEADLVRLYRDAMAAQGVPFAADELWRQYRLFTFAGLIMAVVASMIVKQTDRGDDMFMAMANRHGRHVLDLEAERLFA